MKRAREIVVNCRLYLDHISIKNMVPVLNNGLYQYIMFCIQCFSFDFDSVPVGKLIQV